jgi:diguanylate cyclase (GGDEF)-like protein
MADLATAREAKRPEWRREALSLLAHALLLGWAGFSIWLLTDYLMVRPSGDELDLAQRRDVVAAGSALILAVTLVAARQVWTTFSRVGPVQPKNPGMRDGLVAVDHLAGAVDQLAEQMHAHMADLSVQALRDPLTRLPNRALFMDGLRRALSRARRQGTDVAVLYVDLDDFKRVNDTLGHEGGDRLLMAVAERLQSALRTEDMACRLGGDEFAVLVDEVAGQQGARLVAERVVGRLQERVTIGGQEVAPGVSVGVAVGGTSRAYTEPEALLRDADVAMYRAKGRGKGQWELFEPGMDDGPGSVGVARR